MKNTLLAILLLPIVVHGQFTRATGDTMGRQTVIPIAIAPTGYNLAQALIYYPDDYFLTKNANKRYPLYLFLHGAGEGSSATNISEVLNTSLPQLIAQGLKPYGIDTLTGDTIKFIVVSPHCAGCGGSFSYPQLQYTIPYLVANYRIDTSCIWAGGLSSGGRGTFSLPMGDKVGDTLLGRQLAGIMPMANAGYDNRTDLFPNLATAMRGGLAVLYTIGDQDPGYNASGFGRYDSLMSKTAQLGKYNVRVIVGGTHSSNVWNPPFPESGRIWSAKYNAWTQMWYLQRKAAVPQPPVTPPAGSTPVVIRKVACTEYQDAWLYSDSIVRSFMYLKGKVQFAPFLIGGRKAVDVSTGFNRITILDDQGYVWLNKSGIDSCVRWDADTTGAAMNDVTSIYGYFYTYLFIRKDGSIWYTGGDDYKFFGGSFLGRPVRISQPAGVRFVKLAGGNALLGLTSTGDVYQWNKGSMAFTKIPLPGAASDITASHINNFFAVVGGYPYVWGTEPQYWGGTSKDPAVPASAPLALKTLWNIKFPVVRIAANQNTVHYIDANGDLYGTGDNVQGELGDGTELVNKKDQYKAWYAWSWDKYGYMKPITQILPGTKFKDIFTGNTFVFYKFFLRADDSLMFVGRNKAFVRGDGVVNNQEATWPNVWDVLTPTMVSPLSLKISQIASYNMALGSLSMPDTSFKGSAIIMKGKAIPISITSAGQPDLSPKIIATTLTQLSGAQAVAIAQGIDTWMISGLTPGVYRFIYRATDNNTATMSDTVTLTVQASNIPPVASASAGPDQTITLPASNATLDASASTDADGKIISYSWTKISGPCGDALVVTGAKALASNLQPGKYVYQVTVTDDSGITGSAQVTVTVNPAPYIIRVVTTWSDGRVITQQ